MTIEMTMQRIADFLQVKVGDVPGLLAEITRLKRRSDTLDNSLVTYAIDGSVDELANIAQHEITAER